MTVPVPEGLRDAVRASAKELAWWAVRYEPGTRPPICLFCTRRGGSTWLMQTIAANRGILPLDQPLEILTPNLTPYQYRRLPKFDRGLIVHPDEDQEPELRRYTDDLMAGRIRVNAPHAFWRRGFRFRTDRLVLKIVGAKPMIDWFDRNYDVDIAYLVRHPVPQALSCIRNNWATTTSAYLRNAWFAETVVGTELHAYASALDRDGSPLERFVVNWVVENLYPLQLLPQRPQWLALSYEQCVTDRDRVLDELAQRFHLDDMDAMRRAAGHASKSSSMSSSSSLSAIKEADRTAMVSGWRSQVSDDDLQCAQRILDRFGITLYSTSSSEPDWTGYR